MCATALSSVSLGLCPENKAGGEVHVVQQGGGARAEGTELRCSSAKWGDEAGAVAEAAWRLVLFGAVTLKADDLIDCSGAYFE